MWVSWPDVGVVDPGSNPVDLESGGSGQDHGVRSLPARLKCLVLVWRFILNLELVFTRQVCSRFMHDH